MSDVAAAPISVTGLDHVVLRVRDLDAAQNLFGRLGFALTPRGYHVGRGSANHTAPFRSGTYIELIQLPDGDPSPFGSREEGPVAVALQPVDSRQVHRELSALGFDVAEPRDLARPVETAAGVREARFVNVSLPEVGPAGLRLFACQHLTRDLVWRQEWLDHANGTQGVARVILVDDQPQVVAEDYRRLFGQAAVRQDNTSLRVKLGSEEIAILDRETLAQQFPGLQFLDLEEGGFVGLTLSVASAERTADVLRKAGIPFTILPGERIVVGPSEASGAVIEFAEPAAASRAAETSSENDVPTITPTAAWQLVEAGKAALVDVRSLEELTFVGRVPGAVHVAWASGSSLARNPRFVEDLRSGLSQDQHLLFLCRSGKRSEQAAKAARSAGYAHVANILEGFEGDLDAQRQRGRVNGWRARGLPWIQD